MIQNWGFLVLCAKNTLMRSVKNSDQGVREYLAGVMDGIVRMICIVICACDEIYL